MRNRQFQDLAQRHWPGRNFAAGFPVILFVLFLLPSVRGADIVLVHGKQPHPAEEASIRLLAKFYGLGLSIVESGDVAARLKKPGVVGLLSPPELPPGLREKLDIPVLIFGVTQETTTQDLTFWSGGLMQGCEEVQAASGPAVMQVLGSSSVSGVLSGSQLPAVANPVCRLRFRETEEIQTVLTIGENAVLVESKNVAGEIFFTPKMIAFGTGRVGRPSSLPEVFSSLAPFLCFLKYAAGDFAWHLDGRYANLTIDDPWLIQPYGNLDYAALVAEMETHNFHTTIAFVPWNFDRSKPGAVVLFREYPTRLSIVIHGNNHAHREFDEYSRQPLRDQTADIKQAIARMERFQSLTGISYDRFMVFPHAVAPEQTFAALAAYNFSGTANSINVPLGLPFPGDPLFLLRPYTDNYADLLSLSRYSVEGAFPRIEVLINSFLGNPLLFYGHESFFQKGIGSFNKVAELVNGLQPSTRWSGLGGIARHLYLSRKRGDGAMDAEMFSNEADLTNATKAPTVFHVEKMEGGSSAVHALTVDGEPIPFSRSGNRLKFSITVPAHQSGKVRIEHGNDLDTAREDLSKKNLYARILRNASDFRDLYLSSSAAGQAISRAYYRWGANSVEIYLERRWWLVILFIGLPFASIYFHRRRR